MCSSRSPTHRRRSCSATRRRRATKVASARARRRGRARRATRPRSRRRVERSTTPSTPLDGNDERGSRGRTRAPSGPRSSLRRSRQRRRPPREGTRSSPEAGSSCASSGRRRGSRAPPRMRPSPSTSSQAGTMSPKAAARVVRRDLLDTYDARLRSALTGLEDADELGYDTTRAEMAALALGYWRILAPVYGAQRGAASQRELTRSFERVARRGERGSLAAHELTRVDRVLAGLPRGAARPESSSRVAPDSSSASSSLVPIEYGRGVKDGRVTLEFEIQEAVTFRDGAASAFQDVEPRCSRATRAGDSHARRATLDELGTALADSHPAVTRVAAPERRAGATQRARSALVGTLYPSSWKDAAKTADFDVIAATLDRLQAAAAAGDWKQAESARLEAYGVFELGPEQRLRGLAPSLFQEVEGYFWYGAGGHDGLVQLIKRRDSAEEIAATRTALDDALARAEERIGSGPQSRGRRSIVNAAIIVFREGLEAVLILAALMASLVGAPAPLPPPAPRRCRPRARRERAHVGRRADRPHVAAGVRRAARGDRLARRDRRAPPDPQLVLPPRLLAGEPPGPPPDEAARARRRGSLARRRADRRPRAPRVLERLSRGLRDRPLPAGDHARGRRGHGARGSRARPARRDRDVRARDRARAKAPAQEDARRHGAPDHLGARGHGRDDRPDAAEGRLGRRDSDRRLELPYWAGLWLGVFPTWEGVLAQAAAATSSSGATSPPSASEAPARPPGRLDSLVLDDRRGRGGTAQPCGDGHEASLLRVDSGDACSGESVRSPGYANRTRRLAARAEPGAAAADARLRDRRAAARARLAVAAVDAELVLHRARRAVGLRVVAERRALALDSGAQRGADRAHAAARPRRRSRVFAGRSGLSRARQSASSA